VGVGIRIDGHLEVMGTRIDNVEYELTVEGTLSNLKEQGLTRVDLIISDGHTGI